MASNESTCWSLVTAKLNCQDVESSMASNENTCWSLVTAESNSQDVASVKPDELAADGIVVKIRSCVPSVSNNHDETAVYRSLTTPTGAERIPSQIASWFPRKDDVTFLEDDLEAGVTSRDDTTLVTQTDASIWNGCRQKKIYSLEKYETEQIKREEGLRGGQKGLKKQQRRKCRSFKIQAPFSLFQSNHETDVYDGSVTDGINKESSTATVVPSITEASIWNGRKEVIETPLESYMLPSQIIESTTNNDDPKNSESLIIDNEGKLFEIHRIA